MADPQLDVLEARVEMLEKNIFGDADKDSCYPKIIDNLANLNNQVNGAVGGRPKIAGVMKKLNELEKFLDPLYTESLTLSKQAKAEIIVAEEDLIRQQVTNLEKIQDMSNLLGSEHVKGSKKGSTGFEAVPHLEGKLQELCKIHIDQQDNAVQLTDETKEILLKYNNIITLLSKQFVQWDELVTQLEIASQPKKVLE